MSKSIKYRFSKGEKITHRIWDTTKDRTGLERGVVEFLVPRTKVKDQLPRKNDRHPKLGYLEYESHSTKGRGPWVKIIVEFFGIDGNETDPVFEMDASTGTFPIENHPEFDAILSGAVEGGELTRTDVTDIKGRFTGFPIKPPSGNYKRGKNLAGIEKYVDLSGAVWRVTYNTKNNPYSDIADLAKIDSPEGDPPTPNERDWMLTDLSIQQRGQTWQVTKEFSLSGEGGSNMDIYDRK